MEAGEENPAASEHTMVALASLSSKASAHSGLEAETKVTLSVNSEYDEDLEKAYMM